MPSTGRTTDSERDESLLANRGGFSFLVVHGVTWLAGGALTFVLSVNAAAAVYMFQGLVAFPASLAFERLLGYRTLRTGDNSLVSLFILIAMAQGLSLPASVIVFDLDPLYLPVAFAATNGGHFLPYSWLHRTRAYIVLAVAVALGPFALLAVVGPEATFHLAGFFVGGALLATSAFVQTHARRKAGGAPARVSP